MSDAMIKAFLNSVRKTLRKSDGEAEVYHVDKPRQAFIDAFLKKLEETGNGNFSQLKTNRTTIQYRCERAQKPRRNLKSAGATQTRANACKAYVSFSFVEENGRKACIVRKQLKHNNHDVSDPEQRKVDRIHPQLADHLRDLAEQGQTVSQLVVAGLNWSVQQGHTDYCERRFYPSLKDVAYLKSSKNKAGGEKPMESNFENLDKTPGKPRIEGVDKLLTGRLREHVVYVQQETTGKNEMVVLLQTAFQRQLVVRYGQQLCLVVQSNKEDMHYGYSVHTLAVHDETGQALPAGFIVSTTENTEFLVHCLVEFKKCNPSFNPRAFVVDPDYSLMEALISVWPQASLLYCWFHVVQAITEWMLKKTGWPDDKVWKSYMKVLHKFKHLRHCNTEQDFNNVASTISLSPIMVKLGMATHLQVQWLTVAERWSYYGRPFLLEDPDTNSNVERLYICLKHRLLQGISHRPISYVLTLVTEDGVLDFFSYLANLRQVGRLQNKEAMNDAEEFFSSDTDYIIDIDQTSGEAKLCKGQIVSKVQLLELLCNCKASVKADLCVHVYIALTEAANIQFDLELGREALAKRCVDSKHFISAGNQIVVISPTSGRISCAFADADFCSCFAHGHGIDCFCLRLARNLSSGTAVEAPLFDDDDDDDDNEEEIFTAIEGMEADEDTEIEPTTYQMIQDLFTWSNSSHYRDSLEIQEHIKQAHALALGIVSGIKDTSPASQDAESKNVDVHNGDVVQEGQGYILEVSYPQEQTATVPTYTLQEWMSMQSNTINT